MPSHEAQLSRGASSAIGPRRLRSAPVGRARSTEALIGRDQELAELRAALADAETGHGALFLITGDPGIGKTRLLEALVATAGAEARVISARCWEAGGATAYWPIVQLLRACIDQAPLTTLDRCPTSAVADLAQLVPELGARLPRRDAAVPSDSPQARVRLFQAVIEFLAALASDGPPLIVALDDIHAADEASLKLLRSLARRVTGIRLLVVGTCRDPGLGGVPNRERLLNLIAAQGRTMRLAGLDRPGVASLLERITGRVPTLELVSEVKRTTEGNPFFVAEVARLMAAEGRRGAEAVPGEVHVLIRRRLEGVAPPVRKVLEGAAVLGQEFELSVLRRLVDADQDGVLDALAHAADLGVVEEVALGRWSFVHSLLRESLYAQVEPATTASLHRRAGEVLAELVGEGSDAPLAQLAHHFVAAGPAVDTVRAVAYSTDAGDSAMAVLAYEEAARWYRHALDALSHLPGPTERQRYDLLMACAGAEWRSSGFGQARETYREAVRVAEALGDGELIGRAALGFSQGGGPEHWVPVLEKALAALADPSVVRSQVAVELSLCKLLLNAGDAPAWVARARQEVGTVRRSGDPVALSKTLWSFHRALQFDPEALDERLGVSSDLLRLAEQRDDGEGVFLARAYRVGDLFDRGDIAAVERELVLLDGDARRVALQYFHWVVAYMRAAVILHRGRADEAEALAQRAVAIGEAVESTEVDNIFACQLLEIRRQQGRFDEMEALARRARQQFPHEFLVPLALAVALTELGRADEARQELSRSAATREPDMLSGTRGVAAWTYLTDVAWATGHVEQARLLEALLRPHAGRHVTLAVVGASLGSTDRSLGRLAALQGRWEEADAWFRSAHGHHERLGAAAWLARGRVDHARMLLARNAEGDERRARALFQDAHALYRELGLGSYAVRVAGLLDRIGTDVGRLAPGAVFKRDADAWVLGYAGTTVRLLDSKGLTYLARLLAHPGRRFPAVELVDGGPRVDPERARHRVNGAVRSAIDRIADSHPALGDHLRARVRVGATSSYVPDARAPVTWDV